MILTEKGEMIDRVLNDYGRDITMLNGLHFDFTVEMEIRDILDAYGYLQQVINNDRINVPTDFPIRGKYYGNCREFLEWLNSIPGFARVTDEGEKVDFIF